MIDYGSMIVQWQSSVVDFCARRKIPNMKLHNLRKGDVYDYALYMIYKQAKDAVEMYRETPSSPSRADDMVRAIKKWYIAVTNSKLQRMSLRIMPNEIFARFFEHIK